MKVSANITALVYRLLQEKAIEKNVSKVKSDEIRLDIIYGVISYKFQQKLHNISFYYKVTVVVKQHANEKDFAMRMMDHVFVFLDFTQQTVQVR